MILTTGIYFAIAMAVAILALIGLVVKLQKENDDFVKELQFFLRYRIIDHNKIKARMAVLQTQFDQLQNDYETLRAEAIKQDINFSGFLADAEFVEQKTTNKTETRMASGFESLNTKDIA